MVRPGAMLLVALLLLEGSAAGQDDPVGDAVGRARAMLEADDVEGAAALLEKVSAEHPRDARPPPLLAYILYVKKNELDRPMTILYEHLERYPGDEYALSTLRSIAETALDRGNAVLAREGYRILRRLRPESREYMYEWARASYRIGDRIPAKNMLRQVIDRFPSYADPYWLLARIRLDDGDAKGAAGAYRELTVQRPGDVPARLALASVLLWNLRDYDAAESEYESALELSGTDASLAGEAQAGLEECRKQRKIAARLRERTGFLGWLLGGILAAYAALFLGMAYLTGARGVEDDRSGRT